MQRFLTDAGEKAVDFAHAEAFGRWFMVSNTPYQADLPNRTGYWLGLHVIRQMRSQHSLHELASWPPAKAQAQTRAALSAMTGGR